VNTTSVEAIVRAAVAGDERAWDALHTRFNGLILYVARTYRLGEADAADVAQTTWLHLVRHVGRLSRPEAVGAWLATTAHRECLRLLRSRSRELPVEQDDLEAPDPEADPAALVLVAERAQAVRRAIRVLPPRSRKMLALMCVHPAPSYEALGRVLDMPVGSIGPTRARCLSRLAGDGELAGLAA
jgi:RNA polymerase sigma factor (sigma-70 family)